MELIEIQAAMADNADDAQNNIPSNRRSVHQTLVQDRGEHLEVDLGDGFITVMKMSSSGVSHHLSEFQRLFGINYLPKISRLG